MHKTLIRMLSEHHRLDFPSSSFYLLPNARLNPRSKHPLNPPSSNEKHVKSETFFNLNFID